MPSRCFICAEVVNILDKETANKHFSAGSCAEGITNEGLRNLRIQGTSVLERISCINFRKEVVDHAINIGSHHENLAHFIYAMVDFVNSKILAGVVKKEGEKIMDIERISREAMEYSCKQCIVFYLYPRERLFPT
jgi:hypothetical protein